MVCACLRLPMRTPAPASAYAPRLPVRTQGPANAYASVPMRTLEVASPHHDEKMMKKHDDDLDNLILKRLVIIKMR